MKKLTYQIGGYTEVYNPETETTEQKESFATVEVFCKDQEQFDECYSVAEQVAVSEIMVEGEFDPITESVEDILNALLGVSE